MLLYFSSTLHLNSSQQSCVNLFLLSSFKGNYKSLFHRHWNGCGGKHIFSQKLLYIAFLKLQQGRIHWMRESSFKHKMETAKKSINFRMILLGPKVMLSQFCSACVLRVKKKQISPWISEHFICSNVGISTSTEAGTVQHSESKQDKIYKHATDFLRRIIACLRIYSMHTLPRKMVKKAY